MMRMTNTDPTPSGLETRQPKRPLIPIARKSYIVDLGCGLTWHVSGSGEALPRLDRLASLWRLQAGGNGVRSSLTFTCSDLDSGEHPSTDTLRSEGWKAVDLAYARIWLHPLVEDVICELGQAPNPIADFSITSAAVSAIYARAVTHGGLPLHGALVTRDGMGVLLCGESGVGKSTCCRRIPEPWHAMCDDHALVLPNDSGSFRAHPFPTWSDLLWRNRRKSWDVQARIPLAAIFFLQQALVDEVVPMGIGEASARLNRSANEALGFSVERLDEVDRRLCRKLIFRNACEVSRTVRAYSLSVSAGGPFWEKIEDAVPELG
jgi:SynChlorMet cassette protein ScmC